MAANWTLIPSMQNDGASKSRWIPQSAISQPPMATGAVTYADTDANEAELSTFAAALNAVDGRFTDAFMTAPSPGIVAAAMKNAHYPDDDAYLDALAEALRVEYEAAHRHGYLLQIDAPDLALERHLSYADRPIGDFVAFVERVIARINDAIRNVPRDRVRLHVCWGNYESPHDRDVALKDILPAILQADVGASCCLLRTRAISMKLSCSGSTASSRPGAHRRRDRHPDQFRRTSRSRRDRLNEPRKWSATLLASRPARIAGSILRPGWAVTADIVWSKLRSMKEGAEIANARLF